MKGRRPETGYGRIKKVDQDSQRKALEAKRASVDAERPLEAAKKMLNAETLGYTGTNPPPPSGSAGHLLTLPQTREGE